MTLFRRQTDAIEPSEASERHSRGELELVDVREPRELAEERIPGALHVPLGELPGRLGELDAQRPVAFVCRSGKRSAKASRAAADAGLDAYNVDGGVLAWRRAGLPLE